MNEKQQKIIDNYNKQLAKQKEYRQSPNFVMAQYKYWKKKAESLDLL